MANNGHNTARKFLKAVEEFHSFPQQVAT
jgi:hypothetical protein